MARRSTTRAGVAAFLLPLLVGCAWRACRPDRPARAGAAPVGGRRRWRAATPRGTSAPWRPGTVLLSRRPRTHPGFRTEWWYFTGNLDGPGGRRLGYQLTVFRNALAPAGEHRPPSGPRPGPPDRRGSPTSPSPTPAGGTFRSDRAPGARRARPRRRRAGRPRRPPGVGRGLVGRAGDAGPPPAARPAPGSAPSACGPETGGRGTRPPPHRRSARRCSTATADSPARARRPATPPTTTRSRASRPTGRSRSTAEPCRSPACPGSTGSGAPAPWGRTR